MAVGAAISIVCKTPLPGGGKSRLRPLLGAEDAAALSACFIRDVAAAIDAVPEAIGRTGYAIYAPAGTDAVLRPLLPASWRLVARQDADLGVVLFSAIAGFLAEGHDCALVINADSPTLPPVLVAAAVAALQAPGERAVFGPAQDGGYYLVGLKHPHRRLFEEIRWSTPEVMAVTLERAAEIGLPVTLLPTWYDIDDAATLALLEDELAGRPLPFAMTGLSGGPALHTRAFLARRAAAARPEAAS
ncbi:MAG: TIGR04282 family arsenosugar biosynthesis glycosyltransferase [Acetobacteraceae bacterium]|nr:TIGR04282 family arsenosugar biosynthesis glycosyltransferase [Acetobacteraceae bacterium]